jgi:hypothetical protein
MLDRPLALGLRLGSLAASSEDSAILIKPGRERKRIYARALFLSNTTEERVELPWIASTYLVGMNESGKKKGNLSYLAGTKKRSDFLIELREGARAVGRQ